MGSENTYLYGGDGSSSTTSSQSTAATSPFTIRNRAAWLYHGNNRVINAGTDPSQASVCFWVKIGYLGKDDTLASRWVDNACDLLHDRRLDAGRRAWRPQRNDPDRAAGLRPSGH